MTKEADLTKIEKPFGLLDPETQRALKDCGGPWEMYADGRWASFPSKPMFLADCVYRQAPNPVTYPQPPWGVIDKRWKWFAKNADGTGWFYVGKPDTVNNVWSSSPAISARLLSFAISARLLSFDYGTCDWKDSLVRRPE